jgi:putative oxidoreductase
MASFMRPFESQVYAVFRIVTGLLFLWHGSQKLFGFPAPLPGEAPALVVYIAGPIELVGGVLVMIGLFTGWAAFLCSGLMAAAYWLGHGINGFSQGLPGLFPMQGGGNGGELAVLYCFAFLFISARGSGIWSVDGSRST